MKRAEIVTLARETLGTPWVHQGRVNGLAMDCAGVPGYVGHRLGLRVEDFTQYGRTPVPTVMQAFLDRNLVRVRDKTLQLGDVVWMRIEREPQHLGIVGDYIHGGLSLIHAYNGAGVNKVVEHVLDATWRSRIVAAWRYPGVEQ